MGYKYIFTAKAKEDLEGIFDYIAIELKNISATGNLMNEIEKGINAICAFPEICPVVSNIYVRNLGVRKKLIKNFIMYYFPDEDNKTIVIVRTVYSRRNIDEVLKNIELTNRKIDKQTNE